MKTRILPIAAGISLFLIACNSNTNSKSGSVSDTAQDNMTNNAPSPSNKEVKPQSPDAMLVHDLIESMYAGIALMKDGEQKATDPAVKSLAQKLDIEHSKLTKELEDLSNKKGWALPAGEPAADKQNREAMGKKDVAQFQKDWLASLRNRHETNIGKLEMAKPSDPDVKAAGEKGLPKVKELLAEIKTVQANLK